MIRQLGIAVSLGLFFGLFFGFVTGRYSETLLHGLSIAFTIWLLNSLLHLFLLPRIVSLPRGKRVCIEIVSFFLASCAGFFIPIAIFTRVYRFDFYATRVILANLALLIVLYAVISGLIYSFKFYRELKEKETATHRLKALATEAQLRAVKAQINPHFLFNTLNSVAELIYEDPKKAEACIIQLSNLYRKVLSLSDRMFIALSEEIELVEDMLTLEKVRFGDRLTYRISCPESIRERRIPALLIEPLVENVIKHGLADSEKAIHIDVEIDEKVHRLHIEVRDNGQGFDAGKSDLGFGLFSVQERLRQLFGEDHSFDVRSAEGEGTRVSIDLPTEVRRLR